MENYFALDSLYECMLHVLIFISYKSNNLGSF